jgi:SAM-dependent methyltransferase
LYEALYKYKDYRAEANLIDKAIKKYKPGSTSILDYGCGTGNHAAALLSKGYRVCGVDKNPYMLRKAKDKLKEKKADFYSTKERGVIKPGSIDVCVLLFDVLSYMNSNEELMDFLSYVKKILANGGLFIFDFWYGPGVINLRPVKRRKEYFLGDKKIVRITKPTHDLNKCMVKVEHEVNVFERNKIVKKIFDIHLMRYFFKNEIDLFLRQHGFKILKFGLWDNVDKLPSVNDWSALVIAKVTK